MPIKRGGALVEPIKIRDYDAEVVCGSNQAEMPISYILPEEWIPPIHNQGATYKCVMFAACQCAEYELRKKINTNLHLSPSFGYGRKECRDKHMGTGLYVSQAIKGLLQIGFLDENFFGFEEVDVPSIISLANERDDLLPLSTQFKPFGFVSFNYAYEDKRWNSVKDALANQQNALIVVSHDYFGESHAVMGIGYTNEKNGVKGKYIIIQNSWGENWKNKGRDIVPLSAIDGIYMFVWEDIIFPFEDIKKTDWFYDDVRAMYLSGIMQGIDNKIFAPNDNIIRGDVAIILRRFMERTEYSTNCFIKSCIQEGKTIQPLIFNKASDITKQFNDVNVDDYYAEDIYYCVANNILQGIGNNIFEPKKTLSRAELAAVIVRAYEKIIKSISKSFDKAIKVVTQDTVVFDDVLANEWHYEYIESAYKYGFMQGDTTGMFRPNDAITRAETAAVTQRLLKAVERILEQL